MIFGHQSNYDRKLLDDSGLPPVGSFLTQKTNREITVFTSSVFLTLEGQSPYGPSTRRISDILDICDIFDLTRVVKDLLFFLGPETNVGQWTQPATQLVKETELLSKKLN